MTETLAQTRPREGLTWQKVAFGDWNPIVRDPLDVARYLFILAMFIWAALGNSGTTGLWFASAVLLVARAVKLPRFYDFCVIATMFLLSWGSALGWYHSWGFYDKVVHFMAPLFTTGLIYILLVRLGVLPDLKSLRQPHHQLGFFLIALALGMAIGAGWEVVEWILDKITGLNRVENAEDTATDLVADTLGSIGSGLILVGWSLAGWSITRCPGSALADKSLRSFFVPRRG